METEKLTDYERKRLENIKRNHEMVAALKIHQAKASLHSIRQRTESKSYKSSPDATKKRKSESPVVIRRSLRTRGLSPDSKGLANDFLEPSKSSFPLPKPSLTHVVGPLAMRDAYSGNCSDRVFIDAVLDVAKESLSGNAVKEEAGMLSACKKEESSDSAVKSGLRRSSRTSGGLSNVAVKSESSDSQVKVEKSEFGSSWDVGSCNVFVKRESPDVSVKVENKEFESVLDLGSLSLEPENIARVVPGRTLVVRFFPTTDLRMIAVGNKFGNVGFWNLDCKDDDQNDGIYLYQPHSGPVSSILVQQTSLSKIITSCYDGFIRLMDAEKEIFDLVYSCDDAIFSMSQRTNDVKSLYFGEGHGGFHVWDLRAGKSSFQWSLHEDRINTIDFNSKNPYIMATSSTDGTACLWDLRNVGAKKPRTLTTVNHKRAVHSAYFSPSGCSLATTSVDNNVGILSGANFEDTSMIYHDNQTGRWISSFRGIWGWDDSYVFIGNMTRGVDVISPVQRRTVMTLRSPHISAIPCRFNAHPLNVGMLAGATAGGQVYAWTSK